MRFHMAGAELFVPDGLAAEAALTRTTRMGISAHQDDLEIMAFHGILDGFGRDDRWFAGVVVTDGAGSPRDDLYAPFSDDEMKAVRRKEQEKAAVVGELGSMALLNYPSSVVKDGKETCVVEDLARLLSVARPETVYTHNLADKHDTHVAVALRTVAAVRALPAAGRPARLYGCEVWRDLDWLPDEEKVALDVSAHENLQAALLGVFDSQICGGKRYDLATMGRRRAHATYHASHGVDEASGLTFAMDLTPLVTDPTRDPLDLAVSLIEKFRKDVEARVDKLR